MSLCQTMLQMMTPMVPSRRFRDKDCVHSIATLRSANRVVGAVVGAVAKRDNADSYPTGPSCSPKSPPHPPLRLSVSIHPPLCFPYPTRCRSWVTMPLCTAVQLSTTDLVKLCLQALFPTHFIPSIAQFFALFAQVAVVVCWQLDSLRCSFRPLFTRHALCSATKCREFVSFTCCASNFEEMHYNSATNGANPLHQCLREKSNVRITNEAKKVIDDRIDRNGVSKREEEMEGRNQKGFRTTGSLPTWSGLGGR